MDQQTPLLMGDELLRLWRETGATILLIIHALDQAAMLSDRVGVMSAASPIAQVAVALARPARRHHFQERAWPCSDQRRLVISPNSDLAAIVRSAKRRRQSPTQQVLGIPVGIFPHLFWASVRRSSAPWRSSMG
jgi:ABC-type taurine transport system ATPase subunit